MPRLAGARRDEERSRAKERVFSFRDSRAIAGIPKNQRPELWNLYNASGPQRGIHPGVSVVELDRTGYLAIHTAFGKYSHRAALFGRRAPGGGTGWHPDHGR
jgi:hypothetical protein